MILAVVSHTKMELKINCSFEIYNMHFIYYAYKLNKTLQLMLNT